MTHLPNWAQPRTWTRRLCLAASTAGLVVACARPAAPEPPTAPAAPNSGCWTAMPPLPFAVQEIYPTAHQGRIHLAGGFLAEGGRVVGASRRHISWSPEGVTEHRGLPFARHHPQLVSHRDRLYLFGGFEGRSEREPWVMTTDSLVWGDDDQWTALASAPSPNAECVSASLGDRIHLAGGRIPRGKANAGYGDHTDSDHHLVFDPATNTWSKAAPALTPRNSAAGAVINGLWYVAGGRTMASGPTDAHEVYDPREDKWRALTPMPKGAGAGGNAAAVLDGALIVVGGEIFGGRGQPGAVHREVWRYDPSSDAWTALAPMPTPRHGLGAVTLGDAIYTVGGATKPSGVDTSNVVERFTFAGCPA